MATSLMAVANCITNILLVEDDEIDVMSIQRSFKQGNIKNPLFIANNGLEALDILRGKSSKAQLPEGRRVILLDLNMPKMGGIEFLKELRADPKLRRLPVIVLTTSDQESDLLSAYDLNVAGYILKPVTARSLAEIITALNQYWAICKIP
jgi:CheY-like chemotaxis protein